MITAKRADFRQIGDRFGISPMLARLMINRDLETEEEMKSYLYGSLSDLPEPELLKDADKAAQILLEKIREGAPIRIISDYDVDGVCSNYILYKGLKRCGATVDYRIPDRIEDGYGINEHLIRRAAEDGIDTILTCDNGISASDQVDCALGLGMTVIITDHHDIPYTREGDKVSWNIPGASAVVNPKQTDCAYPFKNICGAVVCYHLVEILYDRCGIPSKEMEDYLSFAALATVCDVMPLRDENRILVREGLARMKNTSNTGLHALLEITGYLRRRINAYALGFVIGPCINASGRLATAKEAMDLLLCEDREMALEMAQKLVALNNERKEMTAEGVKEAIDWLEETGHCEDKVLVVYLKDCHESIAGIIAGRVREHYNKPVFVLTRGKEGIKGSGRSIENYHMFREMTGVKDCFIRYGGHPMAAGLSMEEDRIGELRLRLNQNTDLKEEDFIRKVRIDIALPFSYVTEDFIGELTLMEPFGTGNEKPLFARKNLALSGLKILGTSGRCSRMTLTDEEGIRMEAVWFGESDRLREEIADKYGSETLSRLMQGLPSGVRMHAAYYPQLNEWRGVRKIQLVIQNYILL